MKFVCQQYEKLSIKLIYDKDEKYVKVLSNTLVYNLNILINLSGS